MEIKMNPGTIQLMEFEKNCNLVIEEIIQNLTQVNLAVVESFDLQEARANHSQCACPHHGTDQCACQLAVLLVYGEDAEPASLMVHGNEERTEVSIIDSLGQTIKPDMKSKILLALQSKYLPMSQLESQIYGSR